MSVNMLGRKTVVALIAATVFVAGIGYFKLVYEPSLWQKEIAYYIEDAERRNASSVWNDWPVFGDILELNITLGDFGAVDSWEVWQSYMLYVEEVQENFYNTYEELSRTEMREFVKLHRTSHAGGDPRDGPIILLYDSEEEIIWLYTLGEDFSTDLHVNHWTTSYWKAP